MSVDLGFHRFVISLLDAVQVAFIFGSDKVLRILSWRSGSVRLVASRRLADWPAALGRSPRFDYTSAPNPHSLWHIFAHFHGVMMSFRREKAG